MTSSTPDSTTLDRQELRKSLRHKRQMMPLEEQYLAAEQLLKTLLSHEDQILPKHSNCKISLYLATDGEIATNHLTDYFWKKGHSTYLPVLDGETLVFARFDKDTQWQTNRFNIKEPVDAEPLQSNDMDLVFLPLVGFDAFGGRLGMGGGFYDKTFAQKAEHTRLIGLAHDCQQVEKLPIASWDVPLDGILTCSQFINISASI